MITYKRKSYPTRNLTILINGERRDITIANQDLLDVIMDKVLKGSEEETAIDQNIYFYVSNENFDKSDEEIAKSCLDEEFELASDEDED